MQTEIRTNPYLQTRYLFTPQPQARVYYTEPEPKPIIPEEAKPLVTFGILQALTAVLQKASKWCGEKLMQGKEFTTPGNVEKAASDMLSKHNLSDKINIEYVSDGNINQIAQRYRPHDSGFFKLLAPVARGENAFYADGLKLAVAPDSKPSLILHELGHAINAHSGKFLKFLQTFKTKLPNLTPSLFLLNAIIPKKENGEKTFIEKYAGLIGFAGFLPTIIEEGLASFRGINAASKLKKTVDKTINLKPLKRNYFFAWMTYLIAGLVFGAGVHLNFIDNRKN